MESLLEVLSLALEDGGQLLVDRAARPTLDNRLTQRLECRRLLASGTRERVGQQTDERLRRSVELLLHGCERFDEVRVLTEGAVRDLREGLVLTRESLDERVLLRARGGLVLSQRVDVVIRDAFEVCAEVGHEQALVLKTALEKFEQPRHTFDPRYCRRLRLGADRGNDAEENVVEPASQRLGEPGCAFGLRSNRCANGIEDATVGRLHGVIAKLDRGAKRLGHVFHDVAWIGVVPPRSGAGCSGGGSSGRLGCGRRGACGSIDRRAKSLLLEV